MLHSGHDIAKIVLYSLYEKGDLITNKKLQKLLYYIDAWALVHYEGLILEEFEAWVHGPVIPSIYREYKEFGYSPIQMELDCGESPKDRLKDIAATMKISTENLKLIDAVLNNYAGYASFQLESLSHSEPPWKNSRKGLEPFESSSAIISKKLMKGYYSSLLK